MSIVKQPWARARTWMVKKAVKSDFLADFVTERRYLKPLLDLMVLERGKFYSLRADLGVDDVPSKHLMIAWLVDEDDTVFRSVICFDPKDLWTGYAYINYPAYLQRADPGLHRNH